MKAKRISALLLSAIFSLGCLAACGEKKDNGDDQGEPAAPLTDKALEGDYVADFSKGDPGEKVLFASDGWTNGTVFNTNWSASQLSYADGQMHLGLAENPDGSLETRTQWNGGEARTTYYYGYGDYEVRMKPSTSVGTASTFFLCTGNYDVWPDGTQNPWDEIDIEFLGKDTTKVQFNYFADGVGGHEHMYDLGFDASKEFHNYGFRWAENYITWFVDGKPVYRVNKADVKAGEAFPKTAGRILMNYWAGAPGEGENTAEGWMGKFEGPDGKTADYEWFKTNAQKQDPPTGDPYAPEPGDAYDGDWSGIEAVEMNFASAEEYTVAPAADKKSAQITYTDVAGNSYRNVQTDIATAAAGHRFMQLTVKNNGTAPVDLRINVQNASNKAINAAASQDGEKARTDTVYGGSFFTIGAGKTAVCEVKYTGVAAALQLMIDSAIFGDTEKHSGDITVSELKFASGEEGGADMPDLPEADNNGVTVNGAKLNVEGNVDDYVVISDGTLSSMRVAYADLTGAGYQNLNMNVESISRDKNIFTVKIKNNGTASVTVRIDVNSVTKVNETNACNVSATQDGEVVATDTTYVGSMFTVGAGEEAVCVVTYDTSRGPDRLFFYFDSATYGDTDVHSGDVTLSEMAFSGEGSYTPSEPEEPEVPSGDPVALTFNTEENSGYTMSAGEENKSWTLGYVGKGNTYKPVTAACAELAAGKDTFTIKIKNNKDTDVTVRVDVQGTTSVSTGEGSSTDCTNKSAVCTGGTGLYTDTTWGGTKVTLAAGEEVTLTITYDESMAQGAVKNILIFVDSMGGDENDHNASVTVSGFLFTKAEQAAE